MSDGVMNARVHRRRYWIVLCAVVAGVSGCQVEPPAFDAGRALADVQAQVDFGPRVPGTEAHRQCAQWLHTQLDALADTTWIQSFQGRPHARSTDTVNMQNIVARFRADASRRVMIGAHWDTRAFADRDPDPANRQRPVDGANDGASGVAVLLEVARGFALTPPPIGVDIVLFDGEDTGDYGITPGLWCQGSGHFARAMASRDEYEWVVIADMVGDRDLRLPKEGVSMRLAKDLVDRIWTLAAELGHAQFVNERGSDIYDDHLPFLTRGIPAVDIIDLDYPFWHTASDTPDKCSPESLQAVGDVIMHLIYAE